MGCHKKCLLMPLNSEQAKTKTEQDLRKGGGYLKQTAGVQTSCRSRAAGRGVRGTGGDG